MNVRLVFVSCLALALIALAGCVPIPAQVAPTTPAAAAVAAQAEPTATVVPAEPAPTLVPTEEPPTVEFYVERAQGHVDAGQYDEAIADYDRAIALQPEDAELYKLRGNAYLDLNDTERARADYSRAIELDPEYSDAYFNRALTLYYEGDLEGALVDANRGIELTPDDAEAFALRGDIYMDMDDLQNARADYDRAVEFDPEYIRAYFNRGLAYYWEGDLEPALADLNRAAELAPDDPEVYRLRAEIYSEMGDDDRAFADFDKAIALAPDDAFNYFMRAFAHYKRGDFDLSLADLDVAAGGMADDWRLYLRRGMVYMAGVDLDKARADFEQVLALNEDSGVVETAESFLESVEEMQGLAGEASAAPAVEHPGRIAYTGPVTVMSDVFTVAPNGEEGQQLTKTLQDEFLASWSPDGRLIAFAGRLGAADVSNLWIIEAQPGAEPRQITTDDKWESDDYSWSPDGSAIAYWAPSPSGAETDVYRLDIATGAITNLTEDSPVWDAHPAWSPDGAWIAFVSDRAQDGKALDDICIMRPDGSEFRKLTDNGSDWEDQYPAWSPDGKQIAFIRFNMTAGVLDQEMPEGGPGGLWVMDADGANPRLVSPLTKVFFITDAPVWSPDGEWIAFTMRGERETGEDVWVVPAAGGDPVNLTQLPGDELLVSWSPDSRALTFTRQMEQAYAQWIVEADGTGLRALLPPGAGGFGRWSPPEE